jgi:hypothetical protein
MKVKYSRGPSAISANHCLPRSGSPAVAERIADRILEVVVQITGSPLSGRSAAQKAGRSRHAPGKLPLQILLQAGRGHNPDHRGGVMIKIRATASGNRDIGRIWPIAERSTTEIMLFSEASAATLGFNGEM